MPGHVVTSASRKENRVSLPPSPSSISRSVATSPRRVPRAFLRADVCSFREVSSDSLPAMCQKVFAPRHDNTRARLFRSDPAGLSWQIDRRNKSLGYKSSNATKKGYRSRRCLVSSERRALSLPTSSLNSEDAPLTFAICV